MAKSIDLMLDTYRYLAERSMAGVYLVQDGRLRYLNRNAASYAGYLREEMIGMKVTDLIHPEDRKRVREHVREILDKERSSPPHCFRIITKRGDVRWLLQTVTLIIFEGREAVLGNCMDVTEKVKAEEDLRRSEEEARRLAGENTVLAEIGRIMSSSLEIEQVYERFARETGKLIPCDRIVVILKNPGEETFTLAYVSGPAVPGRGAGDVFQAAGSIAEIIFNSRTSFLLQPDSLAEVEERFPSIPPAFQRGIWSLMSVPLIFRDEVLGTLSIESKKARAYTEQDLRQAEKIALQISGAVASAQLFQQRRQAEKALQDSEKRYRVLVETSHDLICEINEEGRYLYISPNVEEITGYRVDEKLGKIFLEWVHPDDLPAVLREMQEGQKTGSAHIEFRFAHKSGEWRWFETVGRAYVGPGGRPRGVTVSRDVTARKQMEEALRKSREEALKLARENAVMAEIGRIIGSTLHIEEVYERFAAEAAKLILFDRIGINLYNPCENNFSIAYFWGYKVSERHTGAVFPAEGSVSSVVMRTRKGLLLFFEPGDEMMERYPSFAPALRAGIRSHIALPLLFRDEVIGTLFISSFRPDAYSDQDLKLAERIANHISGAIANAQFFMQSQLAQEKFRARVEELQTAQTVLLSP